MISRTSAWVMPIRISSSFDLFSEALQMGYDSFSTPTQITHP